MIIGKQYYQIYKYKYHSSGQCFASSSNSNRSEGTRWQLIKDMQLFSFLLRFWHFASKFPSCPFSVSFTSLCFLGCGSCDLLLLSFPSKSPKGLFYVLKYGVLEIFFSLLFSFSLSSILSLLCSTLWFSNSYFFRTCEVFDQRPVSRI